MELIISDIDIFSSLYKIELNQEPNQSFDVFLEEDDFIIDIRTYVQDQTRINVTLNNEIIINNSPVNISNINLNYFSNFKKGIFFFLQNPNKIIKNPNFKNFGDGLDLYYGII
ncbi:TPA: hypothetical protein R5B02_001626 [Campylobacter jejuni]|nr:hypothetical protein [Campylobacter jejuni]